MNITFKAEPLKPTLSAKEYQNAYNKRNKLYTEISKLKERNKDIDDKIKKYSLGDTKEDKLYNDIKSEFDLNSKIAGFTEVKGEGLKIIMKDGGEVFEGEVIDDNIKMLRTIHDDDMIHVVNELKLAGSEAISINNQRILYDTGIICGGQFLIINGVKIPAPFYINVIGDPEMMETHILRDDSYIKKLMNREIQVEIKKSKEVPIPASITEINPNYLSIYEKNK